MSHPHLLNIVLKLLPHALGAPTYAHEDDSGMDLLAAIPEPRSIPTGDWQLFETGITLAIPIGWEAQCRSRSGLALKEGLFVLNTPGTIDAGYRGEIKVILFNAGKDWYTVQPAQPIAQLVIVPVFHAQWMLVPEGQELPPSTRGAGGFGSTGMVPRPPGS